jgi:hypothetical protein
MERVRQPRHLVFWLPLSMEIVVDRAVGTTTVTLMVDWATGNGWFRQEDREWYTKRGKSTTSKVCPLCIIVYRTTKIISKKMVGENHCITEMRWKQLQCLVLLTMLEIWNARYWLEQI